MTPDEDYQFYCDILDGKVMRDQAMYDQGRRDYAAGKPFHEGPQPHHSGTSLSWRLGWNDEALAAL